MVYGIVLPTEKCEDSTHRDQAVSPSLRTRTLQSGRPALAGRAAPQSAKWPQKTPRFAPATPAFHPQHPQAKREDSSILPYISSICPYHIHTTRTFFKEKLRAGLSAYPAGSRNVKDDRRILEFWRFMELSIISHALCCGLSPMTFQLRERVTQVPRTQRHNGHNHNLFGNPAVVHWCLRFLLSSLLTNPQKHGSRTKKHTWSIGFGFNMAHWNPRAPFPWGIVHLRRCSSPFLSSPDTEKPQWPEPKAAAPFTGPNVPCLGAKSWWFHRTGPATQFFSLVVVNPEVSLICWCCYRWYSWYSWFFAGCSKTIHFLTIPRK